MKKLFTAVFLYILRLNDSIHFLTEEQLFKHIVQAQLKVCLFVWCDLDTLFSIFSLKV